MLEFYHESMSDSDLPLERVHTDQHLFRLVRKGGRPVCCFNSWEAAYLKQFDDYQWMTLAPFLTDDPTLLKYKLDNRAILPWKHYGTPIRSRSATSEVHQIEIHPSHHKFSSVSISPRENARPRDEFWLTACKCEQPHNLFALKTLKERNEFELEVKALKKIRRKKKKHLTPLLTTFEHQTDLCLLFQWAEGGNLKEFWTKHDSNLILDEGWIRWLAEQCHGLAEGLSGIHNAKMSMDEVQPYLWGFRPLAAAAAVSPGRDDEEKDFGRHGDIKPANILWFQSEPNEWGHGVLKITDFGLTAFHREQTTRVFKEGVAGVTLTYMAPEYDLNKHVHRSYDIWSLGCVYLEFATWAIMGGQAVLEFGKSREKEMDARKNLNFDQFYGLKRARRGAQQAGAEVKKCVVKVGNPQAAPLKSFAFKVWEQCSSVFQQLEN